MRWPGWSGLKDQYQVAFGNDTDADRHGIVTPAAGLMNPNHYLAVAIRYLLTHRPQWRDTVAVGKTLVSSSMIDRVVKKLGRKLSEVPVGFKWFVPGLVDGSYCFGGEESAGASFLRLDGTVWTTDKDGPIMDLLAAEITARTGKDPGEHYRELTAEFGTPYYTRIDAPATPEQKAKLEKLSPDAVKESDLAGEPITAKLTKAPGNDAPIGGLKVVAESGWFAARPSGTENIYKIYAESFKSQTHLNAILSEAQEMVNNALGLGSAIMTDRRRTRTSVPPFPPEYRASGLLLHVTSLPSPYGIGDLGSSAFSWIDRLHDAGQAGGRRCRSVRLVTETRPINRISSFAGNELLISPDSLISDGLIQASDGDEWLSLTSRRTRLTTILLSRSNSGCSKRRGQTSKPGRESTEISRLPTTSSAPGKRIGWKTTLCSAR